MGRAGIVRAEAGAGFGDWGEKKARDHVGAIESTPSQGTIKLLKNARIISRTR